MFKPRVLNRLFSNISSSARLLLASRTDPITRIPKASQVSTMFSPEGFYRPHILIVGGSYGGLSVATNLLNLMKGGAQMSSPELPPELENLPKAQPRITILDERDGICRSCSSFDVKLHLY